MKKSILAVLALALALAATTVFAKDGGKNGGLKSEFDSGLHIGMLKNQDQSKFVIVGTVNAIGSNSLTVNAQSSVHVSNIVNGLVMVNTDSKTKIMGQKNTVLSLADMKTGDRVSISGTISGSTLTAASIRDPGPMPSVPSATSGKVTAVGLTSITVTNGLTSSSQIFTTDSNTKISIDGTAKTIADIQVGDAGSVRSKSVSGVFTAKNISLFR